ncbi:peptide deformylase [Candidatus Bipolaricaulota bacterium]|nr:peptide deformylase [Candidatus Bipolaricaulota bacterium]MCF7890166.1 peptide deformylase [Candidatus Bipolaricaulota bacterium]
MALKELLLLGDEKLRQESEPVSDISKSSVEKIKKDLHDTLTDLQDQYGMGRALAAPQIGHLKQIIYYNYDGESFYMINPRIVAESSEKFQVWDSCFSFNLAFFVQIPRSKNVTVKYLNGEGANREVQAELEEAELFQHEIDHLNGKLAVDHLQSPADIITREEWEKRTESD